MNNLFLSLSCYLVDELSSHPSVVSMHPPALNPMLYQQRALKASENQQPALASLPEVELKQNNA